MDQPPNTHLAQLNVGRLVADTDDPRVAEFMANLDRINGLGTRMAGFVWMMSGSGEPGTGNTEIKLDGDPRYVSNLTVWEDGASLDRFVFGTLHRSFYERRADWFELMADQHFVMWWVPAGHRPSLDEALDRLNLLRERGPGPDAFGWAELRGATLWRDKGCETSAA